jgi:hypothetical protein
MHQQNSRPLTFVDKTELDAAPLDFPGAEAHLLILHKT